MKNLMDDIKPMAEGSINTIISADSGLIDYWSKFEPPEFPVVIGRSGARSTQGHIYQSYVLHIKATDANKAHLALMNMAKDFLAKKAKSSTVILRTYPNVTQDGDTTRIRTRLALVQNNHDLGEKFDHEDSGHTPLQVS